MNFINYIKSIVVGIFRLLQGMYISMLNLVRPKITEQYPENRKTRKDFERFRGMLTMPHNEQNQHRCTACGICAIHCPNGTINVVSKKVADETGKEQRVLEVYTYDLGCCTFCGVCTTVCPQNAIAWTPAFEHAVFTRSKLVKQLNKEGSTLMPK
ncbi:NADH-quinone oxidoreductase subunit I [Bacteroidia bacterium]|nr:NADH-quinone oxidoreductase subunit I [Bacteroidia bacterium]GHT75057.1 NADH-quinone oxidoreductase subunit I [Bacteroidia bacterium]